VKAQLVLWLQLLDGAELPIGEVVFAVGRGELHAVAHREGAIGLAIDRDALEAPWRVGDAGPVLASNGHVRWAAKKGYTPRSPISDGSMLRRKKVAQRRRRLRPDEESQLLEAAGRVTCGASLRLQWLIIAALETGARVGELLALQWTDVNLEKRTVFIRATETGAKKTGRARLLPMSARLAAVLDMAKTDPAGRWYPPTAYVFRQLGEKVRSVKKAWTTACEEANLSDLHFHDLRHEAGSRWLEAGWPIHFVKEMLGHSNISQTDTYLNASAMGLQDAMRRFDDLRCTRVAQIPAKELRPVCNEDPRDADKGLLH
jgi:integrase